MGDASSEDWARTQVRKERKRLDYLKKRRAFQNDSETWTFGRTRKISKHTMSGFAAQAGMVVKFKLER